MTFLDLSGVALYGHALVARSDLPLPDWLFGWAAALVLIISFFALSAAWRKPIYEAETWRPLEGRVGRGLGRLLAGRPFRFVAGFISVALLCLTVYAGLAGTTAPDRNFALTFVFVTVWLGFPFLSIVLGDLYPAFNPWRAIALAAGRIFRAVAGREPKHLTYPQGLGRWPAAIGILAFVWLEIVHGAGGGVNVGLAPDTVAQAILVYSVYTFAMVALFGTQQWFRNGDLLSVYFNMFSQLGIFELRDGRLGRRRALAAASRWAAVPGSIGVVLVSIAGTTFDGAQEGVLKDMIQSVFNTLLDAGLNPTWALRLADSLFMLACVALVVVIYFVGLRGMRTVRGAPSLRGLAAAFAHTLIPIAFAYLLAHYFSLFVYQEQAQFTFLLSDPLGTGNTNLFGTASHGIDYNLLGASLIWYVQVGSLIVGHVLGLVLAHDRAVAIWGDYRDAARSQYWMLAVMVAFTCLGLYLLSVANG